mgnify:CR=1 FL=1
MPTLIEENINALADAPGLWDSKVYKAEPSKKTTLVLVGATVPRNYIYKGSVVIGSIPYLVYEYSCNDCISGNVYAHCWQIPNRC